MSKKPKSKPKSSASPRMGVQGSMQSSMPMQPSKSEMKKMMGKGKRGK